MTLSVFVYMGERSLWVIEEMGRMVLFLYRAIMWLFRPPFRPFQILKQLHFIGYKSTFVVALTGVFTGMVLSLQGYHSLRQFGSEGLLGSAVALSIIRELGPVLASLIVMFAWLFLVLFALARSIAGRLGIALKASHHHALF